MTDFESMDILMMDIILKKKLQPHFEFDTTKILNNLDYKIFNNYNVEERNILNKEDGVIFSESSDETEKKRQFTLMQCKKRFLDLMTSMVAKEVCFTDKNQTFVAKFQLLVNTVYNTNLTNYINYRRKQGAKLNDNDILFLYKGGTTMKILYDKYKKILLNKGFNEFFNDLPKEFERSDSDYTILINPSIQRKKNNISFERVYYDINVISYHCLDILRNYFNFFPNFFVPLNLITDDIILNKLTEMNTVLDKIKRENPECTNVANINRFIGISYLNKDVFVETENLPTELDTTFLASNDAITSPRYQDFLRNHKTPTQVPDFIMSLTNTNNKYYKKINPDKKDNIYLSMNESNEYNNNGVLAYFSLHRLKINFVAYYISNDNKIGFFDCPSELIDVSILKKQATGLPLFYSHADKEFKVYKYENPKLEFQFKSYSIYGHINDLIFTLFDVSKYPWDDAKYKKRIRRLMFFIVMEIIINVKNETQMKNLLILIKSLINDGTNLNKNNNTYLRRLNTSIINRLYTIKLSDNVHFACIGFFERLVKLMNPFYLGENGPQFNKFMLDIKSLLDLLDVANLPDITDLTENSLIKLLGGQDEYYLKYLKYKAKYLKLKNEN